MVDSMLATRARKAVGAVAAAGVALGGLAVIAPDVDAQAYGLTCDLVLNTDAPEGDQHWDTILTANTSMGGTYPIPVYKGPDGGNTAGVSAPFAPMSTASVAPAAAVGKVICVVGRHAAVINGTTGSDTIIGGAGDETINGGGGDDVISGNGGDDVLIGKAGDDSLSGGAGNDILFGHAGQNTGTPASTEPGADDGGNDTLNGNDGNDLLRGDYGNDLLNGNNGDDCLLGGKHDDEVYGWNGDDTIGGGSGSDYLAGNDNNDYIFGGKGNDTLRGNDGLDQIWGDSDLYDVGVEMTLMGAGTTTRMQTVTPDFGDLVVLDPAGAVNGLALFDNGVQITAVIASMADTVQPVGNVAGLGASIIIAPAVAEAFGSSVNAGAIAGAAVIDAVVGAFPTVDPTPFKVTITVTADSAGLLSGAALSTSGQLMGPIGVPTNKIDIVNSSNVGGIALNLLTLEHIDTLTVTKTVTPDSVFALDLAGLEFKPPGAAHWTDANGANPGPIPRSFDWKGQGNPPNVVPGDGSFVLHLTVAPAEQALDPIEVKFEVPVYAAHQRSGHLEVAACNLDQVRIMDGAYEISRDTPLTAFSGEVFTGLATVHMSMIAMSQEGDLEVMLLKDLPTGPGPSGAFLDWPTGVDLGSYDDNIRGGDSDDLLYGEAGSDVIYGDHGDDSIWGEGDTAAWVLGDAVLNRRNGTKRPVGRESDYTAAAGSDHLAGNIDDDSIEGGPKNDTLTGGPDDDHLIGDSGSDRLDGGDHWDACQPNGGFVNDCEIIL